MPNFMNVRLQTFEIWRYRWFSKIQDGRQKILKIKISLRRCTSRHFSGPSCQVSWSCHLKLRILSVDKQSYIYWWLPLWGTAAILDFRKFEIQSFHVYPGQLEYLHAKFSGPPLHQNFSGFLFVYSIDRGMNYRGRLWWRIIWKRGRVLNTIKNDIETVCGVKI